MNRLRRHVVLSGASQHRKCCMPTARPLRCLPRHISQMRQLCTQALWGDYAYQPKTKRIVRMKGKADAKPLFVQLALEPLWKAYTAVEPGADSKVSLNMSCHSISAAFSSASVGNCT